MSTRDINTKKIKENLALEISTAFYQIFTKNLRHSVSMKELDNMRLNCKSLATSLLKATELKSVDLSIRLATATDEAFKKVEEQLKKRQVSNKIETSVDEKFIERLETKLKSFETILDAQVTRFEAFQAQISDIRQDIRKIDEHRTDSGK